MKILTQLEKDLANMWASEVIKGRRLNFVLSAWNGNPVELFCNSLKFIIEEGGYPMRLYSRAIVQAVLILKRTREREPQGFIGVAEAVEVKRNKN